MGKRGTLKAMAGTLVLLAACSSGDAIVEPETTVEMKTAGDLPAEIAALQIRNARVPAPNLLTAGQLSEEQMTALRKLGFGSFINLRLAAEEGTGWEETYAENHGIEFHRLEVAGAAGMTRENVERLAELLADADDKPVVLYCASSNRVGALLALKASYLDGKSLEDSLALGTAGGMTRLEPKVRELLGVTEE